MGMNTKNDPFTKEDLTGMMKNAKNRVRVLGVLPFNFDWDELKEIWFNKINKGKLSVEIICEAEHFVNLQSIIASDKRISGEERSYELGNFLNILAAPESDLRKYLIDEGCNFLEPESDIKEKQESYKQRFSLRTCYLPIPIPTINIDKRYFITFALTKFNDVDKFEEIDENHYWYSELNRYFKAYFDYEYDNDGVRKYSTELTAKKIGLKSFSLMMKKEFPQACCQEILFSILSKLKPLFGHCYLRMMENFLFINVVLMQKIIKIDGTNLLEDILM